MNVLIRGIILTVLLVALGASSALALLFEPPHSAFVCSNCHFVGSTFNSTGFTNFCNSCHNPASTNSAQLRPFSPNDASNIFNNVTAQRSGVIMQTSHNWAGGKLDVPKAGAVTPPTGSPLLYAPLSGLSCDRCHAMHGPVPQVSTSSLPSQLKVTKDMDTICFECHSPRKTTDHKTGSHPVTMTYTTAIKKFSNYTTQFYKTPVNANPKNSTSAMSLQYNNTVLCSTCHGVHWTDSKSATFDNASSVILGRLSSSEGYLLRTDRRGAKANDVNICTNCHKGKLAHNNKSPIKQNIQCTDCHGGHVDEADGSKPNVWLVNRYMVYSTGTYKLNNRLTGKQTIFTSVTNKNYRNANNTGVCQSCHAIPASVPEHTQANVNCNTCHFHNNTSGSFAATSCTACHGQPPTVSAAGGPNGSAGTYLASTTIQEANTPHGTHAAATGYSFACLECHQGYNHADGNYQNVLNQNTGGTVGIIASYATASPTYSTSLRQCANMYCHSNGAPRTAAALDGPLTTAAAVNWVNGKGTFAATNCASCHGNSSTLATNVHAKHVNPTTGKNYACGVCHSSTVAFNKYTTILDKTKHVNKSKDVSFGGLGAGTTYNAAVGAATCATSYCHSNGKGAFATPSWTSATTGACGTCHLVTRVIAAGTANLSTNGHFDHFSSSFGPKFGLTVTACQKCHTYTTDTAATHVNGAVDVTGCAPCHQGAAPTWSATRLSCESCHSTAANVNPSGLLSVITVTAPNMTLSATRGHTQSGFTAAPNCSTCHNPNSAHISGALGDNTRLRLANTNAQCNSCHNVAGKTIAAFQSMSTHITTYGQGQDANFLCKACHDPHGTSNLKMIRTDIYKYTTWAKNSSNWVVTFTNRTSTSGVNGFVNTKTNRGLCQICHSKTKYWRSGVVETNHPNSGCFNCHTHNAPGGAFKPSGSCDACHGYPPAPRNTSATFGTTGNYLNAAYENYSGGGGAHLIPSHIPATATAGQAWSNCTPCHNGGAAKHTMTLPLKTNIANVSVIVDPKYKFNTAKQITYSGAKLVYPGNKTGQCTNTECHFQPSPKWGTTAPVTPSAGTISLSTSAYSVNENGGTVTITATRTGGSLGAVGISYATSNGTATAGADYTAASGTLSWAAGDAAVKTFTVAVTDDVLVEGNETFNVVLSSPTGGATLGTPASSIVTIVDNDVAAVGTIALSAATYSVNENGGTVTITATRTGGSSGAVGISYATSNGTATAGSDYTAAAGTLSWTAGDTAGKTFTVAITDDVLVEGNETFNVTLSSPTGGATLGTPASSVVSIVDNDVAAVGTIALSTSTYSVNENGGTVTITATRTGGSSGAVGVSYATSNGTATSGTDYTAAAGTLSWATGDTAAKTFTVAITDDVLVEGNETFNVTLSSPTGGATLGTPASSVVTIVDNDVAVGTNYALAANGGVASAVGASSYPPSRANDGVRAPGSTNFWRDLTYAAWPDPLMIAFNGQKNISKIDVITAPTDLTSAIVPVVGVTTFTANGITDYVVQYCSDLTTYATTCLVGSAVGDATQSWVTVGSAAANNLVWKSFTFASVPTFRIRVVVTGAMNFNSRIVELEAY